MARRSGGRPALERDLGVLAVVTISLGAMIGSGIFVLPGLAVVAAGPAAPLAYLLAGLVVLPAALSKAELATAMPQSGGTYLFIDRAMGPLVGTVAGFGVWFSLVFKAAFALVGLGAYLQILVAVPGRPVAIVAAGALIALNIAGTRQSGRAQTVVVLVVLIVLVGFVLDGARAIDPAAYRPLLPAGFQGLLAASGLVFVSYAGVTKIASIAEEIRDPGRVIPVGILSSIALMAVLYTLIVTVVVGVVPADVLRGSSTPIALAAERAFGDIGQRVIALTAVLALLSMANAGLLTSSRYPFAMSRDALLPPRFEHIHARFATPANAIGLTGGLLLLLVAFVPVIDLAKLASAFQLLVFTLINITLIVFRTARMSWYRPAFRSPAYPWTQVAGIVGGLVLLTEMGALSILGAAVIIVTGVTLYRVYGRARTVREGVALDVMRRRSDNRFVRLTERALQARTHRVAVVVGDHIGAHEEAILMWLAVEVARSGRGEIHVLRMAGPASSDPAAPGAPASPATTRVRHGLRGGVSVSERWLVGPDHVRDVVAHVLAYDVDLVLVGFGRGPDGPVRPLVDDPGRLMDALACDAVFVRAGTTLPQVDSIVVMGAGGPFDELKVVLANRIAIGTGAGIRFVHVVDRDASDRMVAAIKAYHARLGHLAAVPTSSVVERARSPIDRLRGWARTADLVVIGATDADQYVDAAFTDVVDHIALATTTPLLVVHAYASHRHSYLGRLLERLLYGPRVAGPGQR